MIKDEQVIVVGDTAELVSDRLESVFLPVTAPRIHTPLNDLPSRGFELIDLPIRSLMAALCRGKNGWPSTV